MWSTEIPERVLVTGPPAWRESYSSTKAADADTWSWYAPGEKKNLFPHFTVGRRDEGNNGWFRFHVTIPIRDGSSIANAHCVYIINHGRVSRQRKGFNNREELTSFARATFDEILGREGEALDELAYRFWYGAYRGNKSAKAIAEAKRTGKDKFGNPIFR